MSWFLSRIYNRGPTLTGLSIGAHTEGSSEDYGRYGQQDYRPHPELLLYRWDGKFRERGGLKVRGTEVTPLDRKRWPEVRKGKHSNGSSVRVSTYFIARIDMRQSLNRYKEPVSKQTTLSIRDRTEIRSLYNLSFISAISPLWLMRDLSIRWDHLYSMISHSLRLQLPNGLWRHHGMVCLRRDDCQLSPCQK